MRWRAGSTLVLALALLAPAPAWAGRAVIVSEGTAGPAARGLAAGLVLLPIVAVLVFALARWLAPQGDPDA